MPNVGIQLQGLSIVILQNNDVIMIENSGDIFPGDVPESVESVNHDPFLREKEADHGWHVLAILSVLMGFASISTDLYLPAMPTMVRDLRTTVGTIDLTVSGYLIGFSIGQLFWGPVSDRYGRRLPVASGLVLFVIGSGGCALAGSGESLIIWRMIQAAGACASVVLARAMVRDLYEGPQAARMLSVLMTVMAIAPLLGPVVGAQILALAGWRAIFGVLGMIGLLTLAALFTLPETLPESQRNSEPLGRAILRYGDLLRHRRLLGYMGAGGFFYAGMFAYIAGTPFAYITYYHVPSGLYGILFGAGILGIMATNLLNGRVVAFFGSDRTLLWGTVVTALSGLLAGGLAWTGCGGLWGVVLSLLVFAAMAGFIVANAIVGAMSDFPRQAGAVSALVGATQYGSGVFSSALVGLFADGTPWPMGLIIALCGMASFASALTLKYSAT
ncbi:Bcr/CflA family drug resistance efflux transporter [Gluconobacter kanchanaburiensis NBRC 103587]|uniref:Bcr/CflA family efflux transporter n=2 Tax=Gluconobacter kanchanaburiensis TaxID=563199 RepID=A0A511BAL7_9PROT|nr:Bcr/CflA family drug resistance efflux transporter [Gluconobacter kanchanaburiensis NBRC 103587]